MPQPDTERSHVQVGGGDGGHITDKVILPIEKLLISIVGCMTKQMAYKVLCDFVPVLTVSTEGHRVWMWYSAS